VARGRGGGVGVIVVKLGGVEGLDHDAIADDVAAHWAQGARLVLVHGGGAAATRLGEALGVPPRFVTSPSGHTSRYTDRATLEAFTMAVAGGVNKAWVERLQTRGVPALGLSGLDGRLIEARHKRSVRSVERGKTVVLRDDHTGAVERIDAGLLRLLLGAGFLPVVAPLAASHEGAAVNVDGDRAASAIAVALAADALVLLSNVPGLLRAFPDEASLVPRVAVADVESALGWAQGRMKKKLEGAAAAVAGGVARAVLADGRGASPLRRALAGHGTVVA
jgi:[amino group carrier protein]-L-2-aminoadipate 6-kinase